MKLSHEGHVETAAGVAGSDSPSARLNGSQGKGTILVVDDEPSVRRLCQIILQRAGYEVLEADSADSARIVWRARSREIDVVLTDYNMPGDTGLQLSESLRTENSRLRVVLMSGCSANSVNCPAFASFLQKPFTMQALTETIQSQFADSVHHCA